MPTTEAVSWEDARSLIERHTGPVRSAEPISEGLNSEISVIIRTDDDAYFVKGRAADHPQAWTQARERAVNPAVRHITPWLRWSARTEEWDLLGFECINGRHVDYSPESPDLLKVERTLLALQQVPCPDVELKRAQERWSDYTATPEVFAGRHLLHTEWSPGNVLIAGRAYLVDWAWPTRGAAWIDPACWVVWLIASGHSAPAAERWGARIPSWGDASNTALDEFARVQAAMWADIAAECPDAWIHDLAAAAGQWVEHRESI